MVVKGKALLELGGLFRSLWLVKRESRQKMEGGWRKVDELRLSGEQEIRL